MSIWNKNINKRDIKELDKNIEVDILIVGAGITGITTAYYLKNENICVVDANRIGHGVTLNSTAKINYFQERIYNKICNLRSREVATTYLKSQVDAIKKLKEIIEENNIDCDFKRVDSYVFANTQNEIEPLLQEIEFLKDNNIDVKEKKLPNKITS